jgi:dihydroxyacetone kinase-like protein
MKKLINAPETVLAESLDGFAATHADLVVLGAGRKFLRRVALKPGKVALVSGGGSGHEPLHAGFVGHGMLDAACPGQVFTSPTPDQMIAAAEAVDTGAGVLFIVKNYEGDVMNFDMAREMDEGGRQIETVLVDDDVAVEVSTFSAGRRGVAGTLVVEKIVGAAAERGDDLAACRAMGERVNRATRSMGVALTSCTVPAAGKPTFQLGADEIEIGVGIHGEPGRRRATMTDADTLAADMMAAVLDDLAVVPGGEVLLLVNGFGATPLMELYVMVHAARARVAARGLTVARSLVGNYVTSLDMGGCSLTITVLDPEITALWDAPVHTPALRWRI